MPQKILIVDDEAQDRDIITLALKRKGYDEVSSTDSGGKALEMIKSLKPDFIIIDVVLKDMDGFDVCRQIKALEGITAKIIMITGHLDKVNAKKAVTSGADEIVEKISGFDNLIQTINNIARR